MSFPMLMIFEAMVILMFGNSFILSPERLIAVYGAKVGECQLVGQNRVGLAPWTFCGNIDRMEDNTGDFHSELPEDTPPDHAGPGQLADRRIRLYQDQLRRLASELSLTEARERREIASDLHDHIGQALACVYQKVTTLRGNAVFSGMEEDLAEVVDLLDQSIRYTRNLTVEISPPVLYELGLPAAIDWLSERAQLRHGLRVKSSQSGTPQAMGEDIRVFVFKALQELITNVAKHARTENVEIRTTWEAERFTVAVSDHGCGFDTSRFGGGVIEDCCFGLFSIRERLSYIGGDLIVASAPGTGTHVSIVAPYQTADEAARDQDTPR